METNIPRVGVGVIIFNSKGEVLLGYRLHKEGFGDREWSFPGGKLEWMESITDCAERETFEETGMLIDVLIPNVYCTNDFWPEINKHFVTVYATANIAFSTNFGMPKVMEPEKCKEWRWFPLNQIPGNTMHGLSEVLNYLFDDFKQIEALHP